MMNKEEEINIIDEIFEKQYNSIKGLNNKQLRKVIENSNWNFILQIIRYLEDKIEELELQNFNLREDIMIKKMALPNKQIKDKTFYDLYDMPTYEDLQQRIDKTLQYLDNGYLINKRELKQILNGELTDIEKSLNGIRR